jgi:hypothetical protein
MDGMEQLMQKLAVSKAIMDKQDEIKRGDVRNSSFSPNLIEDYNIPQAKYNIPQEFLQEQPVNQPYLSESRENTKPVGVPSIDAIKNSKLPDEIKRLMMEHPIAQAQTQNPTLSNDLIERATRLMNVNSPNQVSESNSQKPKSNPQQTQQLSGIDYKMLKKLLKEVVDESLSENGLIMESSEKTNEIFTFKVGKHIFEGKVTKIKKLS